MPHPADILAAAGLESERSDGSLGIVVRLDASIVAEALAALREAGYDLLVDLFGCDTGDAVELTYHVRVLSRMEDAFVKATVAYDGEAPSAWHVFPAALYPEREAAEMFGIAFPGHPNPKRLLLTEGVDPLLRKSVPVRTAEEVRLPDGD